MPVSDNHAAGEISTPLSIGNAARRIGVSVKTMRRYAENGRVKSTRTPGGHYRFDPADVDRFSPQANS